MTLDVWYKSDIQNALRAAEAAANATACAAGLRQVQGTVQLTPFMIGFLIGYRAALATIALTFGLNVSTAYLDTTIKTLLEGGSHEPKD